MTSRRYVKRIWRVPKTRGALEYCATLVVKALVKHGWPARWQEVPFTGGFEILVEGGNADPQPDFIAAIEIAGRIVARTYRLDIVQHRNFIALEREYEVTVGGHFKEVKQ